MTGHPVHVHHLPSFHTCEMNKRPLPGGGTMPLNDRKWVCWTDDSIETQAISVADYPCCLVD
jgi:hypothetical protein